MPNPWFLILTPGRTGAWGYASMRRTPLFYVTILATLCIKGLKYTVMPNTGGYDKRCVAVMFVAKHEAGVCVRGCLAGRDVIVVYLQQTLLREFLPSVL